MGWLPKEQFRGPESSWIDAEAYVERGNNIMPILKANNEKLIQRLSQVEAQNAELTATLKASSEAIEELKNFRSTLNKEKVQEQKTEILAGIKEAKTSGDVDAEVALTDKLTEVNAALKAAEKPPEVKPAPAAAETPQLTEAGKIWLKENEWFGKDQRRTALAYGLSNEWKTTGKPVGTPEYFEFIDTELAKVFDPNAGRRQRGGKVEETNSGSGDSGGGGSKTFADLPREAQEACKRQASKLVGKGRAYENLAAWQKAYVETYDWS